MCAALSFDFSDFRRHPLALVFSGEGRVRSRSTSYSHYYCCGGVLVPELVPLLSVPVDEPALFAPLDEEPALFASLDDEPALFAPVLRSELVPEFVRVRSVSLVLVPLVLLLLGRVVGSLLVESVFVRLRLFVPVSLLSQPINAIPPSANAAATRIP